MLLLLGGQPLLLIKGRGLLLVLEFIQLAVLSPAELMD
uniref:Uncharacterized protein n=1 Tax=Lotus japonicus TaxID=34305 RepID=I3SAT8_LOTJA|nr:unknown [Lotus japonicus]